MRPEHRKVRDFLSYALGYGPKLGLRVIPLRPGKKTPLIPNWQNEGTWDEATIREWWRKWPNANIGILTGRYRDGYFIVLDFDPRNGGDWWDEVGEAVLPDTWVVHTPSGGRHFYYRTDELLRGEKLPDGVDLKGEGGYVVAPPSVLYDDEGNFIGDYDFQVGNMPKELGMALYTQWGLEYLRRGRGGAGGGGKAGGEDGANAGGGENGRPHLWLIPPPIPKGMRHDYLVSLAGALWSAGLTEKEVDAILRAALELLETLDDFEPEREIGNIVKGLQKWEGESYTIGSLLQMLPERTAGVVRRVVTGGVLTSAPTGTPVSEGRGADSGQVASAGEGQDVCGQEEDTGANEKERRKVAGRLSLAAEIVGKLQVCKGEDGVYRYVYRAADGSELEAACAPEGVRDLLAKLGVKMPLKEVKRLLGLSQTAAGVDAGEAKEKKGPKAKTAAIEDIKAILWRYKWVKWQGELWVVSKTKKLLRADIDEIHGLLKQEGLDVGKETLRSYYADLITDLPKDPLEGVAVTPSPKYGKVGNLRGLWFCHRGDLYFVTPKGGHAFRRGEWPDGVYALDLGMQAVLPDWEGDVIHLLKYWEGLTSRFEGNPKVALAMFLPVLFGQGDIGIILRGPAKSGKSTLLKGMAFLHLGRKPDTPSGNVNMRDIIAVLQRRQIAFFDEVNTFSPELQETLKRMITHDGVVMRALYTNFDTVETELSGSAIFCTTNLEKLASDLRTRCFVWDLREKKGSLDENEILTFCAILWRKALAGAIKLYQRAAQLPKPPNNLLPQVRFRDWLSWAYRYAVVLGVENEFVAYVAKSKRAAHRGDKYDFLLDAILHPDFDPKKEYTLNDLIALTSLTANEAKRIRGAISRDGVRADMIALALDAGLNLRIEKGWDTKDRRERYKFIFSPIETSTSNHLREILESLGIKPPQEDDDDTPPPTPPTSTPNPTPPIAPTPPPPPPTPTPTPPDNTGGGAHVVAAGEAGDTAQDETNPLTDMDREKKAPPSQLEAGASAAPTGLTKNNQPAAGATPPSTSAAPPKAAPRKAPPPSEWTYRAGTTPKNAPGAVSDGLFAHPQNAEPTPTPQPPTGGNTENTSQDDEYPTDDELIAYIDERLREQSEGGVTLEGSLDFLNRFLLRFEEEMWQLKRVKSLRYIQNWVIVLQNAIKDLGYDELTPEKDPRLRTPAR